MRQQPKRNGSKKAQISAARLAAVQALYQMEGNGQAALSVIQEYVDFRFGERLEGEAMVVPDRGLFSRIVRGVQERRGDLDQMIAGSTGKEKPPEKLIYCILLCGVWELLAEAETDAPIIISDYLHVTDAFYDLGEKKLVNAVLDKIAGQLRP